MAHTAADLLNADLLYYLSSGVDAGAAILAEVPLKCNPATHQSDDTYTAAAEACPPRNAPVEAMNDPATLWPMSVAADAAFAAVYAGYRRAIAARTTLSR